MSGNAEVWRVLGASVRGTSHRRKGTPNEDAWGRWHSAEHQLAMGVVADGHGDSRSVRSHVGSRLAVESVRQVVEDRATRWGSADADRQKEVATASAKAVVARWRRLIAEDLMRNPLRAHEFDKLEPEAAEEVLLNPVVAYGTTMLMTIVAPDGIAHIGIGDGDILNVDTDGCSRAVFGEDSPYVANETASLCMDNPVDAVRVEVQNRAYSGDPALVLLCTDGVSNAFRRREGFYQLGADLIDDIEDRSDEAVAEDLPGWLEDFSSQGSGDDVTACILVAPAAEQDHDNMVKTEQQQAGEESPASSSLENWEQKTEPCDLPGNHSSERPVRPGSARLNYAGDDQQGWYSTLCKTLSDLFTVSADATNTSVKLSSEEEEQ